MGIRVALGAQASDVFRLVVVEGLKLSLIGAALGAVFAWLLAHAVSHLFYTVSANVSTVSASRNNAAGADRTNENIFFLLA